MVFLRHGQTQNNLDGIFTGWENALLTPRGDKEAQAAGLALKQAQQQGLCKFDLVYSSRLQRAIDTVRIALEQAEAGACAERVEIEQRYQLNERHYGALQGLTRDEAVAQFGHLGDDFKSPEWLNANSPEKNEVHPRFTLDWRPPSWLESEPKFLVQLKTYEEIDRDNQPNGESLLDTWQRIELFWQSEILPEVKKGQCVLIGGHGNTFRAFEYGLRQVPTVEVPLLKYANAVPRVFEFDGKGAVVSQKDLPIAEFMGAVDSD